MSDMPLVPDRGARRDPHPLATRAEVAAYLGVAPRTLEMWACRGTGPRFVRVGRPRYRWSDVEKWLAEQQTGGGDAA